MDEIYTARSLRGILVRLGPSAALIALGLTIGGCGTTLEDGYKPHVLGSTPEARKSYYASPFTDQAEAGSHDAAPAPALHSGSR